jgi:hypothetical protein
MISDKSFGVTPHGRWGIQDDSQILIWKTEWMMMSLTKMRKQEEEQAGCLRCGHQEDDQKLEEVVPISTYKL